MEKHMQTLFFVMMTFLLMPFSAFAACCANTQDNTSWSRPITKTVLAQNTTSKINNVSSSTSYASPAPSVKTTALATPLGSKHYTKDDNYGSKLATPVGKDSGIYTATVYAGSLRDNITRIVNDSGWGRVVWKLPYDYRWVGTTQLSAPDVKHLVALVLDGYPIQATFYDTNRVLVVEPRVLND